MKKSLLLLTLALYALPANGRVSVLTHRCDNLRSNQKLGENTLTSSNVSASTFGKVYTLAIDGYARPLYFSKLGHTRQGHARGGVRSNGARR